MQVVDTHSDVSFIFEPNEESSFVHSQISFMRPNQNEETVVAGRTLAITFVWDVQLAPEMEMEKTINFTLVADKKRRKKI